MWCCMVSYSVTQCYMVLHGFDSVLGCYMVLHEVDIVLQGVTQW